MKINKINIKEDLPDVTLAIANMLIEIERTKIEGVKALKVIHGYGSSGAGGEIKKVVHRELTQLVKKKVIKEFFPGEKFSISMKDKGVYLERFPSLLVDGDMRNFNSGLTIIFLD